MVIHGMDQASGSIDIAASSNFVPHSLHDGHGAADNVDVHGHHGSLFEEAQRSSLPPAAQYNDASLHQSSTSSGHLTGSKDFRRLELRLARLEARSRPIPDIGPSYGDLVGGDCGSISKSQPDDGSSRHDQQTLQSTQIVSELTEKPWEEFINKYPDDTEFAIEVLQGDPGYYADLTYAEKTETQDQNASKTGHKASLERPVPRQSHPVNSAPLVKRIPDRIRINSPQILRALATIDGSFIPEGSLLMLRPYKFLVHHEHRIREMLVELEGSDSEFCLFETMADARTIMIEHIICLVQFIDVYLRPTLDRLQADQPCSISFRDLWYIFTPGENVYMPLQVLDGSLKLDRADATAEVFRGRYEIMWRICGRGCGRPILSNDVEGAKKKIQLTPFQVNAYYIDFDGRYFLPTIHAFSIHPFEGEKDVLSLDFFPARFMQDGEARVDDHYSKGESIFRAVNEGHKHFYYSGTTLTTQPCGCALQTEPMHQENVESDVIVDFETALLQHPAWKPQSNLWRAPPMENDELLETTLLKTWSTKKATRPLRQERENVYDDTGIDLDDAFTYKERTPIFSAIPSAWTSNARMVPEEDFSIFPARVFGFVLRTRTFAPLWLWKLSPIKPQNESLTNLRLRDNSNKDIIQAMMNFHFSQVERNIDPGYDVVRGKNRGLIILLHGVPGVGKTSTVESIAAAHGKPLWQITCGDLGENAQDVEKSLKDIFRYAQQWGCVLLLDECDIFLGRRTKDDITHNALVSVFLRSLEMYSGVLFLTTNRVGVLDDALKSRLTWTSYYPPLNWTQTREIWKTNIRLVRERYRDLEVDERSIKGFARKQYDQGLRNNTNWNGREIQNAFKVAIALATNNTKTISGTSINSTRVPRLQAANFETVSRNSSSFHDYFLQATGFSDADRAFHAMERDDQWDPHDLHGADQADDGRPPSGFGPVQWHAGGSAINLTPKASTPRRPSNSYEDPPQRPAASFKHNGLHRSSSSFTGGNGLLSPRTAQDPGRPSSRQSDRWNNERRDYEQYAAQVADADSATEGVSSDDQDDDREGAWD